MSLFIVVVLEDREEREKQSREQRAESSNSPPESTISMPKIA